MHRPFKVVIVDDSLTMRRWLNSVIAKDPRLNIVGMAGNAQEAREVIKATQPDVLTLDIEMPGMNGLEFLAHLMRLHPMPVVMLASSVQNGSVCAQQALDIGAVACVAKPQVSTFTSMAALCESIFSAACGPLVPPVERNGRVNQVLLVGASTGGVDAIETMLASLKGADIPPIVILKKPALFTACRVRPAPLVHPRMTRPLIRLPRHCCPGCAAVLNMRGRVDAHAHTHHPR
jgi:two-component system chemotaxis response regulator CheB